MSHKTSLRNDAEYALRVFEVKILILRITLQTPWMTDNPDSHHAKHQHGFSDSDSVARLDEDFDSVLDDLKEDGTVELPPHACR